MAPSPVLISSPRRAFGTMKSSMFGNTMPSTSNRRSTPSGSPTKRPLAIFNDENADPTHPKRVKSALSSKCSNNENILFSKQPQPQPPVKQEKTSRFVLTDRPQQKPRSALGNVTNTHHRIEKSKPRVGSSLKNVVLNASPPRRRPTTPPRSARDRRVPFAVRVDPPVSVAVSAPSSIDSVIRGTSSRQGSSLISEITPSLAGDPLCAQSIPDSWQFTIYEDTPEETLQNMMEHSTNTLDLSDDESSRSELSALGKENIPPARLAEILATAPESQMSVDVPVSHIPQRHTRRQPLREMVPVELEKVQEEEGEKCEKVPTLEKEGFMTVTTPEKKKPVLTPRAKGALKFTVWKDPVVEKSLSKSEDQSSLPPVGNTELKGVGTPTELKRSNSGKKRGLSEI